MAKTNPLEFLRQVQTERRKITWPSQRETIMTGVMVVLMTTILGVFFFTVDSFFAMIVKMLLSMAA